MASSNMKATVVFEVKIDLPRIQEAVEKVTAALAEFGEACTRASDETKKLSANGLGPEFGSVWKIRGAGNARFRVLKPNADELAEGGFGITVQRIESPHEVTRHSVAEFSQRFVEHPSQLNVPAPSSLWEFVDDRDPDGLWAVAHDYRGDTTMVTLKRIDGPMLQADSAFSWHGSVANHNKTFRRSNA